MAVFKCGYLVQVTVWPKDLNIARVLAEEFPAEDFNEGSESLALKLAEAFAYKYRFEESTDVFFLEGLKTELRRQAFKKT